MQVEKRVPPGPELHKLFLFRDQAEDVQRHWKLGLHEPATDLVSDLPEPLLLHLGTNLHLREMGNQR